jgi:hypothetical protein
MFGRLEQCGLEGALLDFLLVDLHSELQRLLLDLLALLDQDLTQ